MSQLGLLAKECCRKQNHMLVHDETRRQRKLHVAAEDGGPMMGSLIDTV